MNINSQILFNAIKQALREMDKCPDDDIPTIWNEKFSSWGLPLEMNHNYEIEIKAPQIT